MRASRDPAGESAGGGAVLGLRERSARADRPILWAALAVFAGSALGASGLLAPPAARSLLLLAGVLAASLPRRLAQRANGARIALLIVILSASALRASPEPDVAETNSDELAVGPWRLDWTSRDQDLGVLGAGPRQALPRGGAASGELLALLPAEAPRAWAVGPVAGPARGAGIAQPPVERLPDEIVRLARPPSGFFGDLGARLDRIRAAFLERASRLHEPLTRALVGGLLLGDLSELPRGVGDLFVRTGTFHILAISGLQVALVAVLLAGPVARLAAWLLGIASAGRVRLEAESLRSLLLLAFVPIAGAGPPVTRSAIACIAGSLSSRFPARRPFATVASPANPAEARESRRFLARVSDPLSIWAFALICECLVHAEAPLSVSVQLTYAATLGLILATGPIATGFRSFLPGAGRIASRGATGRLRPELARILAQKAIDSGIAAVAASCAAVLATLAVVWWRFGEWSPSGILATPAIGLPVAWILVVGWVWMAIPGLVPEGLLDMPARATIRCLETFDRLPGTPCPLPQRPFALLALAVCFTMLLLLRARRRAEEGRRASGWIVRASAAAWAAVLFPWALSPAGFELHVLDVGHGTAALFRGPGGGVWIFDAGSRDRPGVDREAVAPLLRDWEASRIAVVLSHPDRDHDGAFEWLIERHPPELWTGALPAHLDERLPHAAMRLDVREGRIRLPNLGREAPELRLEVSRGLDVEGNEGSRCLEILWRDQTVLLSGDAGEEGLAHWLRGAPPNSPARLLLFPHHGSDTPHLGELLQAVRPEEIWLSASGTPPVAPELDRREIRWRCTSGDGPLKLALP